jgi:hypothetical protein
MPVADEITHKKDVNTESYVGMPSRKAKMVEGTIAPPESLLLFH